MRKEINSMVRAYAKVNGNDYESAWNRLYKEFNSIAHIYVKARAKKRNCKPLDIVEQVGKLSVLYALAKVIF